MQPTEAGTAEEPEDAYRLRLLRAFARSFGYGLHWGLVASPRGTALCAKPTFAIEVTSENEPISHLLSSALVSEHLYSDR